MSVGGRLIEIHPTRISDLTKVSGSRSVLRLWVVDRTGDETCVYAKPQESMPAIGDEIWWQSDRIMFDGDRQTMRKVGYSFAAPGSRA